MLSPHGLQPRRSSALLHPDLFSAAIWTPLGTAVRTMFDHDPNLSLVTCALFWAEMLGTDSTIWALRPDRYDLTSDDSRNAKHKHNASLSVAATHGLEMWNTGNLDKAFKKAYPE